MNTITQEDQDKIRTAKAALEGDSIALRMSAYVNKGMDILVKRLPEGSEAKISRAVNASLTKAVGWVSVTTGSKANPVLRGDWMHKGAVLVSGALGGFGGLATVAWELPLSTMLMLRSIGCIAEEEGLSMSDPRTRLGCVSVLSMGADSNKVQADELSYWVARKAMSKLVTEALEWNGRGAIPPLVKFLSRTSARFGVVITEKLAAQAVPVAGALAGAGINHIFLDHYQKVAHAHFTIERLCLCYGETAVKSAYASA